MLLFVQVNAFFTYAYNAPISCQKALMPDRIIRTRFKAANLRRYCVKCLVPV